MATLVFVETDTLRKARKSSLEAITYARLLDDQVTALVLGTMDTDELKNIGKYGANKIVHIPDEKLNQGIAEVYAVLLAQLMEREKVNTLVAAESLLGSQVGSRVAVRNQAAFVPNVIDRPNTTAGFVVKQSIYAGKAYMYTEISNPKKIIIIKKHIAPLQEVAVDTEIVKQEASRVDADFAISVSHVDEVTNDVPLPEAEFVVSGGRGMRGSEQWGVLEDLASALGAALACSKPVSDMGWRPHYEHVGQTGVKIAPQLYIAVGISGAIQHLAGVNASKYIVVINKDPEAPFFKAADYGIVGDAFEVVPKLTAAIKEAYAV